MSIENLSVAKKLTALAGTAVCGSVVTLFMMRDVAAQSHSPLLRNCLLVALVSIAVIVMLAISCARSLQRPLSQAIAAFGEIERGNYQAPIEGADGAGSGSLLGALVKMQRGLNSRLESEIAPIKANAHVKLALDRLSAGVMMADMDGKIVYSNDFAQNIFRTQGNEIRKQIPQFDVERIIGSSFDIFHRSPSHQRNLLAGLTGMHTADIKLGGAVLRVIANPVNDAAGKRTGTVVVWMDRTMEVTAENEMNAVVERAVEGDLTARVVEEGKTGFYKSLAQGMNKLIGSTGDVVRTMSKAADEVRTGADEISRGNLDLSQRTEEQASSLEETASSMEEMTATVKNNADNAAQANQLASAARDQAERGGKVVGSAVAAMSEINAASKKIADIIGVIDEIAFQTNLLALNAAVEAARAGEQGRGFAVVASEVRNLASRSAEAAKEIKGLIQDSVGKVTEGTRLVDESGKVLGEIVTGVKKVTDVVAEIAASSREQASGIEQVNKAVTSMDEVTQQNAALVEEASAAAQALTEQAANLSELIAHFKVGAATARDRDADAAIRPERRETAKRPWSGKGKPAPARAAAAPSRKAAGAADAGYKDF
jgi:methyl-accepting chemotaxis protein